jgi:glycine/D-amino acid oxidase-like deaminating enzyme
LGKSLSATSDETTKNTNQPCSCTSEVVGAYGRMGSVWLCHDDTAAAVPRGVSAGCLTKAGYPIYVATPSYAWSEIWHQTLSERREDLVFVGNGIPPPSFEQATVMVSHFSVLQVCRRRNELESSNPMVGTNALSPKTFLYGRHSERAAQVLEANGVQTEIVESFSEIRIAAARKLVWASCLWLLSHSNTNNPPLTVAEVHEQRQPMLDRLVTDLLPALEQLVGQSINRYDMDEYLKAYSLSIPDAIPSRALAIAELEDRNGVWLAMKSRDKPQTFHQELIQQVTDKEMLENLLQGKHKERVSPNDSQQQTLRLDVKDIGLAVKGDYYPPRSTSPQQIIIVGGGMIGSSVALFLAQRRPDWNITVLDQLSEKDVGRTTPASWAWLNANGKSPKSYQLLNQLGLHAWKHESHLSSLVSWMGSLVRFEERPAFVDDGGYLVEGPLSFSRILELEPFADWKINEDSDQTNSGYTYFFPDEGCVDPLVAVQTLRRAAEDLGVKIVANTNVTNVLRNKQTGNVRGIEAKTVTDDENVEQSTIPADLVVVAAGVGAAAQGLGGLPLLHRPGQIAYASPTTTSQGRLSRILVDPLRSSHVLQRADGSIVAGGGSLEVGGASGSTFSSSENKSAESLLEGAKRLSPSVVNGAEFTHASEAVRPMPKDGLPVVGYLQQGLYTLVTHSGITLGPLLSALAAGEIDENISCDLLSPYRPSRFVENTT